ncbi:two-component system regulatory protein YycI [Rossellomorea aquimaris]|uniref:two-component system regulatory protein YycI n=1 Tax=Rossellomorea TaxID=2837508 RepID=UPI001653B1E9|nr:two-component system regulatory protein YycI [Rossellomorea vietnamensis]
MDWSKTKTIFIIVFLILDIFLLTLFINKYNESQYDFLSETKLEDRLKVDNIKYELPLSKDPEKQPYINAITKAFTAEDIKELKDQSVEIIDSTMISSKFEESEYVLSEKFKPEELTDFINKNILNGDAYSFWGVDEEQQRILYYQNYKEKPIFNNINGELAIYFDEDRKIVSYTQTLMTDFEEFTEKKSVITPIQAVETLYSKKKVLPDSSIGTPEIGFYTLVPEAERQVLSPAWHFIVTREGEEEHHFVNAFEGNIIEFTNTEKEILE